MFFVICEENIEKISEFIKVLKFNKKDTLSKSKLLTPQK